MKNQKTKLRVENRHSAPKSDRQQPVLSRYNAPHRRGGRVAEGAPLLREYRLIPYRGFESLSLRHQFS